MDTMEPLMGDCENYEQLLKAMGFSDENEIRQALCISNNDINEAVAILTNEKLPKITSLIHNNDNDIDMNDANMRNTQNDNDNSFDEDNPLEFPVECLYQLENSVFTDNWSIPYKKDEWLGRLLVSTISLLKEDLYETNANCKRFLDRVMPEVYKKLLNSTPVNRWNAEIQLGVYNMTCLAIELIAIRLSKHGVPDLLLNTLQLIFNRETEFHSKNMSKAWDRQIFNEKLGSTNLFTIDIDTYGWLLNLINIFGSNNGFIGIKNQIEQTNNIHDYNQLLKPLAICCQYFNHNTMIDLFESSFHKVYDHIKKIDNEDFKDKNIGKIFELFSTIKKLSFHLWSNELDNLNALHLNVVLNMLKFQHFNAKMNSLKEICKLIDLINGTNTKITIKENTLIEWIISQKVLSLAVEGNIDQSQYCEKIKTIVEFIGDRIKNEEIAELWKMQFNKPMSIVENLYNIIAIAATKFNIEQLYFLLNQINDTWNNPAFLLHDKLVNLLKMIGRDAKTVLVYNKILETLWELKSRESLSRQLILLIYNEHLNVLTGCRLSREQNKRDYLKKCCDDIKLCPGATISIASLKHIYDILCSYQKGATKSLKEVLTDIIVPFMKTICISLVKFHTNSSEKSILLNKQLEPSFLVDDVFQYEEAIQYHLSLIKFILQEGNLYLNLSRAQEIWNVLITDAQSCEWDKCVGFQWFIDCILDLNDDSRAEIFKKQILNLKSSQLTHKGYECFKLYFLRVNEHDGKIIPRNDDFIVEKHDLIGRNFLWDIILFTADEEIADLATRFLLEILYEKVSVKLKRDVTQLHKRFIQECYERLENCLVTFENNPVGQLLWNSFRVGCLSTGLIEFTTVESLSRPEKLKCIERILMIAEKYIVSVEETSSFTRTNLPHFVTFKGEIFPVLVYVDGQGQNKVPIELFACSNETLSELRQRITLAIDKPSNTLQIYYNDKLLNLSNDQRLLYHLNIDGMSPINVKISSTYPPLVKDFGSLTTTTMTTTTTTPAVALSRVDVEQEKALPGVIMASGEHAFELLYRLEELDDSRIQNRVRNLLNLIPTDPKLLEAFDRVTSKAVNTANSNLSSLSLSTSSSSISNMTNTMSISDQSSVSLMNTPSKDATLKQLVQATFNESQCSNYEPKPIFKDFTRFFEKALPLNRILYHLEALTSRIAPLTTDLATLQSSELFLQDFLKSNGLEVLVSLLKLDGPMSTHDYEKKQKIYITNLQLLRLILFGSIYPSSQVTQLSSTQGCVNKRPSTEPITTCAKKTITTSMVNTSSSVLMKDVSAQNSFDIFSNVSSDKLLAGNVVNLLSLNQITEIISQLSILIWSAAAGNINLAFVPAQTSSSLNSSNNSAPQNASMTEDTIPSKPHKEVKFAISNQRLSTSSNMSTSSIDSYEHTNTLHSGICMKQQIISTKDIKIASKAIEILTCFMLQRRDCIHDILNLSFFNEFIIDVLTGSTSADIRSYMEKFLYKLSQIETPKIKCKDYLLSIIIKARIPLWVNSSCIRGSAQRLITQSSQYFNLRSLLIENMTADEQAANSIDIGKMLDDEINWLNCFTSTKSIKEIDSVLLSGHFTLIKALLTTERVNKIEIGERLISQLIKTYLFPAAYILNYHSDDTNMEPICSSETSRTAAYNLLVELSQNCLPNFIAISKQLIQFHHKQNTNDWNYIPPVTPRADCGLVGLKNGGATCYMNAVIQQLFIMPGISEYLLSIEDEISDKNKSVFCQLQNVFAHLKESKLEYYIPEGFWKAFRIAGQEVNIREQQDAFDFFISLTDQIDEHLKTKLSKQPIFKNIFEGTFSNQFICKDCPHRYEREESFYGLNLIIKAGNLEASLSQFVKDELLDGDNAYNCEKCGEKRSAIKRTCIKKLPKYLCIQLKRFDYDWESNRSLKFDDYFEFPRRLNVQPYMTENFEDAPKTPSKDLPAIQESSSNSNMVTDDEASLYDSIATTTGSDGVASRKNKQEINYDLVGIIVHSGQANAGHYYSFIKAGKADDGSSTPDNDDDSNDQKWYKFNDTTVEEIDFNNNVMADECFGGMFTCSSDTKMSNSLPDERVRYWNAYMLIYKVQHDVEPTATTTTTTASSLKAFTGKTKYITRKEGFHASKFAHDSLSELAELVTRGDEKGLFNTCLPPSIEQLVRSENLEFCKNKEVFSYEYFQFIFNLAKIFKLNQAIENYETFCVHCTELGLEFLFNTLFKTGKKLRTDLNKWLELFGELLSLSKEASFNTLNYILDHELNSNFIRYYLLECSTTEIREACAMIFENSLVNLFKTDIQPSHPKIQSFILNLLQLLDKAVIDLCKNSREYFMLLFKYANVSKECAQHLISGNLFTKLLTFLLGSPAAMKTDESINRRWSSMQSREFGIIHELIGTLVLRCNLTVMKTIDYPTNVTSPQLQKYIANANDLIPMPSEMQIYIYGALSNRYLKELVFAFEEINHSQLVKTLDMIVTCCFCNEAFSANLIHQILFNINNYSTNEIKQVLYLLQNILLIEDELQLKRLRLVIDGYKDNEIVQNGLLNIIKQNQSTDAKKTYHCVKFIIALANKSTQCKDYLMKTAQSWEWAVNWLKTKMNEFGNTNYVSWSSTKSQSNDDSDTRTFQRTKSAQRTLDDATALFLKFNEAD